MHKSTSHRRPVNWGGQLQTSLLAPGTHVPAMTTRQIKYRNCNYVKHHLHELYRSCTLRDKERNFTATWIIKVYSHRILCISVTKLLISRVCVKKVLNCYFDVCTEVTLFLIFLTLHNSMSCALTKKCSYIILIMFVFIEVRQKMVHYQSVRGSEEPESRKVILGFAVIRNITAAYFLMLFR